MSYMEKLLDGIEVVWKSLEDIANFANGKGHEKVIVEDGKYIVVNSKFVSTDGRVAKYSDEQICPLYIDDILIVMSDLPNGKALAKTFLVDSDEKYTLNQRIGAISVKDKKELLPKFLNYFLNRTPCLTKYNNGVDQTNLKKGQILDVEIPIPCPDNPKKSLEIQAEIVRILDTFTELTTELTTELNARKKQYNYYRDQLLSFEEGVGVKKIAIGDIYDFQYGTGNKIPTTGGQYPVYGSNGIVGSHDEFNSEDSPVIGHIGAYAGIVNWGEGKHFVTYNGVICRHKSEEVLAKYAYYLLLLQDFGSKSNSASQPFVSYHILKAPVVWVPCLKEQARIVAILDKFNTLTSSITEGLPREIALRQQQYEYYRDLLLSFPESRKPKPDAEAAA